MPFVVESTDKRGAQARVWVATKERAEELIAQAPGRTYREVSLDEMAESARKAMEAAK